MYRCLTADNNETLLTTCCHVIIPVTNLRKSSKCLTRARRFLSGICIFPRISGSFTGGKCRHSRVTWLQTQTNHTNEWTFAHRTAARGAGIHTGRTEEGAGRSGGSCQGSASNSGPAHMISLSPLPLHRVTPVSEYEAGFSTVRPLNRHELSSCHLI